MRLYLNYRYLFLASTLLLDYSPISLQLLSLLVLLMRLTVFLLIFVDTSWLYSSLYPSCSLALGNRAVLYTVLLSFWGGMLRSVYLRPSSFPLRLYLCWLRLHILVLLYLLFCYFWLLFSKRFRPDNRQSFWIDSLKGNSLSILDLLYLFTKLFPIPKRIINQGRQPKIIPQIPLRI